MFTVQLTEPILEKAKKLKVYQEDIVEKFVVGGGSGGQKINKTASCVWLKHVPTGTEVKVQRHRERAANRKSAYKQLILKIEERVLGKRSERAQVAFKKRKQKKRRSRRAKEKMVDTKKRRGQLKATRKPIRKVEL